MIGSRYSIITYGNRYRIEDRLRGEVLREVFEDYYLANQLKYKLENKDAVFMYRYIESWLGRVAPEVEEKIPVVSRERYDQLMEEYLACVDTCKSMQKEINELVNSEHTPVSYFYEEGT